MPDTPEQLARRRIDELLVAAGWQVQDRKRANITAARGVAIREFPLKPGYGFADYLLYIDGAAAGVIEAKKEGATLTGVEIQTRRYSEGLPERLPAHVRPLPLCYQSTGTETRFTCGLDPEPRSRRVFSLHRPETLAAWIVPNSIEGHGHTPLPLTDEPRALYGPTLRHRLRHLPSLATTGLWPAQIIAVQNLERSLVDDRPRALIQMATGSGKTVAAITSIYWLVKFADARRVLFLVDRANLGRQTLKEFQGFTTPDDGRKFTELFNVQHLASNKVDPVARATISTIQRVYSILRGEPELDPELDEHSAYELASEPLPVEYNPGLPPEAFDVLIVDE